MEKEKEGRELERRSTARWCVAVAGDRRGTVTEWPASSATAQFGSERRVAREGKNGLGFARAARLDRFDSGEIGAGSLDRVDGRDKTLACRRGLLGRKGSRRTLA